MIVLKILPYSSFAPKCCSCIVWTSFHVLSRLPNFLTNLCHDLWTVSPVMSLMGKIPVTTSSTWSSRNFPWAEQWKSWENSLVVKGNFRGVSESHNSRKKKSHLDMLYFNRKPTDFGPLVLRDTVIDRTFIKSLVGRSCKSKICRQKTFWMAYACFECHKFDLHYPKWHQAINAAPLNTAVVSSWHLVFWGRVGGYDPSTPAINTIQSGDEVCHGLPVSLHSCSQSSEPRLRLVKK